MIIVTIMMIPLKNDRQILLFVPPASLPLLFSDERIIQ